MSIEAVCVKVVMDGDRARVVEPQTHRVVHSVRLDTTASASSAIEHVVNISTYPLRKRAPERLRTENSNQYRQFTHDTNVVESIGALMAT